MLDPVGDAFSAFGGHAGGDGIRCVQIVAGHDAFRDGMLSLGDPVAAECLWKNCIEELLVTDRCDLVVLVVIVFVVDVVVVVVVVVGRNEDEGRGKWTAHVILSSKTS